jgi:diguanylate cyclase (GGDEF)-like protein
MQDPIRQNSDSQQQTMQERRKATRTRSLRHGRILFNDRRSVIDCVIRNLSNLGACLEVANVVGVPPAFDLQIDHEAASRQCAAIWYGENRIGVEFRPQRADLVDLDQDQAPATAPGLEMPSEPAHTAHPEILRGELLALRAALFEVPFGVVLLDSELRAQFINRAFRKMWRLPDNKADAKPAFVSLMYHGCETRAYDVPEQDLKAYVAQRVAHVKTGNTKPVDLRLTSGEVIRFQGTPLPNGGRMLSYTYVTDIVKQADELQIFKTALDHVKEGVSLLDSHLRVQFMNSATRKMWKVSDDIAERKMTYAELVNTTRLTNASGVSEDQLDTYIAERITAVRNGDPTPADVILSDGRTVRLQCAVLPIGGRMMTYTDVTDLVQDAAEQHHFATTDGLTELYNRRHFLMLAEAEWQRFQRYQRPLSLLIFDIDHFKFINDKLGHDAGDRAIVHVAELAREDKRPTDILARIGGDEFVMLLPETDIQQAGAVAERLRAKVERTPLGEPGATMKMTVSIGAATAIASMPDATMLLKQADEALYQAKFMGRNRVNTANQPPIASHRWAAE